jgi:hypothetical protein
MVAVGVAIDFAVYLKLKSELQAAADAAALGAAHEIPVAKSNFGYVASSAKSFAQHQLGHPANGSGADSGASPDSPPGDSGDESSLSSMLSSVTTDESGQTSADRTSGGGPDDGGSAAPPGSIGSFDVGVQYDKELAQVSVSISAEWTPTFAAFLGTAGGQIEASASARYFGAANICVLGLSPSTISGVRLWNDARLTAMNCSVFSNTMASDALAVMDAASLMAKHICVTGGYDTASAKAVTPQPITDCPPLADPLAARPPPSFGDCDFHSLKVTSGTKTLLPGVYCGGLSVSGDASVTLDPGIYVIKDGPLMVTKTAKLHGVGTGFYFTGAFSTLWFDFGTTIDLEAPTEGALAGLLFFEDRAAKGIRIHRIASNNARNLLGTIYLPVSILNIDSSAPVADQSAYTAIVTKSLQLQSGPDLVLNTDYDLTSVPVPEGIKGSGRVVLTE